jgi:hypothetical protein
MTIPAVPLTGTGLTQPLISIADYQRFTGDLDTEADALGVAIADAVESVSLECNRTLSHGRFTENLYLTKTGMVFPSAAPIDATQTIVSGPKIYDPTLASAASVIQGYGIWVGWFSPLPWMPVWSGVIRPQAFVTYSGGFQPYGVTTGPTEGLPLKLARAIAKVAWFDLHPAALTDLPGGVKSVSLGGVSMSGNLSSFVMSDPQLVRDLKRFKRRQATSW